MAQLKNKIAIVTGAASGFGACIARRYIEEGAKVVLADINYEGAARLADELGDNALAVACNVTSGEQVQAAVQACVDAFGVPDIVVNNAGTTHRNQPLMNVDEATFDRVYAVNVKSIFHMVKAVVPLMRERGTGSIINVGSVAGIRPRPGLTWYNGSKGAVNLLSKSLAVELGPDGIRVNNICPVMGETALLEDFMGMPDTPENRAKFVATIPLGRMAKPADIAAVAVFLATDDAAFLNGVELPVDGGRVV
ncbi:SDR family oxidoreductase [Pseudomonas sp.]|uniref:SDR family oxidoreductase n=1 Tax=Pseudomonas sp. TaxID=306 RepID=UPI001A028070|nr:SDR family oxidoreductase [Pseudomonas sp.]MBF0674483.1 SDR family oxidoreductase [Pseudomonas sp.]